MQASTFIVIASLGFLVGTHGKIIPESEPQFNVFAVLPFIISRHCSLMNKSESTKEIQEIVRQKTEPLLDLSRALLIKSFGISHTVQESEMFEETLSKYCKNDHSSWGKNTEEWMAAVKPCFQDNIYKKIIEAQDRINSSLKALCNHQSNDRVDDFVWEGGATDPERLYSNSIYSPVNIYASCYIRKGVKSTDQIIETVYEKFRPLWELQNAFNTMTRHSYDLNPIDPKIDSFLSSLQNHCVKHNRTFRSDLMDAFQATSRCYGKRGVELSLLFRYVWPVGYACQHQDQVEGFLRTGGLECGLRTTDEWISCANIPRHGPSNPCEDLRSYSKITKCASRSLQNCTNSGGAGLFDYMHQEVSKMLPCNVELFR